MIELVASERFHCFVFSFVENGNNHTVKLLMPHERPLTTYFFVGPDGEAVDVPKVYLDALARIGANSIFEHSNRIDDISDVPFTPEGLVQGSHRNMTRFIYKVPSQKLVIKHYLDFKSETDWWTDNDGNRMMLDKEVLDSFRRHSRAIRAQKQAKIQRFREKAQESHLGDAILETGYTPVS